MELRGVEPRSRELQSHVATVKLKFLFVYLLLYSYFQIKNFNKLEKYQPTKKLSNHLKELDDALIMPLVMICQQKDVINQLYSTP